MKVAGSEFTLIGLTGGIASGKSLVARILTESGIPVLDADKLGHEVLKTDESVIAALLRHFGRQIVDERGQIDRSSLASRVFTSSADRLFLESVVHPAIMARVDDEAQRLKEKGGTALVVEAAVLIEAGWLEHFDFTILVASAVEYRIRRLMSNRAYSEDEARKRISAQGLEKDKEARVDFVVRNNGSREDLKSEVIALIRQLKDSA